jgi:arylsulfatase A-like enzyme
MDKGTSIAKASIYGLSWWLLYGAVETVLMLCTELHQYPETAVMPWQWIPLTVLLAAYALVGTIAGAATGCLIHFVSRDPEVGIFQITTSITLTSAFALNGLLRGLQTTSQIFAVMVAIGLTSMFLVAVWSKPWRLRTIFVSNPLTISLLLLGVPWVYLAFNGRRRFAILCLLWMIIVVTAFIVHRMRGGRHVTPFRQLRAAFVICGLFVVVALFDRVTPQLRANASVPAPVPAKPNVVLITMDTVRADHMSLFGYAEDTTPNLREFARGASVYSNAIATSDFTLPGHASIFTGLYPSWHGAQTDTSLGKVPFTPLPPNSATLANTLFEKGYSTPAVVANYGFLTPEYGVMQGFSTLDRSRPAHLATPGLGRAMTIITTHLTGIDLRLRMYRRASDINQAVSGLLGQARGSKRPFFLFVNYMEAHAPYSPAQVFEARFRHGVSTPSLLTVDRHLLLDGTRRLSAADIDYLRSQYDAAIATEDALIADLIAQLRASDFYDETMIVITADHGESLGERDLWDHNLGTVYQEVTHIPLVIKYPKQQEPIQSHALVSQTDLLPTILHAVGVEPRAKTQGRDLRNYSCNDSCPVFIEARAGAWKTHNHLAQGDRTAVILDSMKYVFWTKGSPELYDLASDPREEKNTYVSGDDRAAPLAKLLENWMTTRPRRRAQSIKTDIGTVERLKSLGYVQ